MARLRRLLQRVRDLVAWQARDRDIEQEMQFHLDALTAQYVAAGMSDADARAAARRQFGSAAHLREQGHDVRGGGLAEQAVREVRYAMRRLVRTPAFTLAAVLTLALAIGANASIFTIVHRVVLEPLPYADPERLLDLDHGAALIGVPGGMGMKVGFYRYYAERARTLDGIAIFAAGDGTLSGRGEPERVRVARTTTSLVPVLGVQPAAGRWFTDAEGQPGAPDVAVISHGLWTRRFGADAGLIGRRVTLDGVPVDIVGVMPPALALPDPRVDVWLPERIAPTAGLGIWTHEGVGRMRDGVTVADVRAELDALIADLPQAFPGDPLLNASGTPIGVTSTARPLKEAVVGDIARTLWILLAAVGVVLLVAAANVANLFLVRAEGRQREVAVRRALGAGAGRIAWLFLAESILLGALSGAVGLFLAWGGVRLLVSAAPATLPRLGEVHVDGAVVAFTLLVSLATAAIFGSIPFVGATRVSGALDDGGRRSTASRRRHRARHVLMGAQVALALVLVAASGLMLRSFRELRAVDPQFEPASGLAFTIGLPRRDYADKEAAIVAHRAILDSLSAVGGVTRVSASTCLPLDGICFGNGIVIEGRPLRADPGNPVAGTVSFRAATGGYFETMGIDVLRGRGLERADVDRASPVAVVDEVFADLVFPNEDPIGRRVTWSMPPRVAGEPPSSTWLEIVGVVSSTPVRALGEPVRFPQLYMPLSLTGRFDAPPFEYIGPTAAAMTYVVRAAGPPAAMLPSIRRAVDSVDAGLAMARVRTLEEIVETAAAPMAFTMVLITIAAAVALLLGLVGIYAVVSYIVSQRTREIGVRLALGAEPGGVAGLVVRQGGAVAVVGVAVGLVTALAGSRTIESLLYGVSPRDPAVFAAAAIGLLGVALLACWVPARRAASLSPVDALRTE